MGGCGARALVGVMRRVTSVAVGVNSWLELLWTSQTITNFVNKQSRKRTDRGGITWEEECDDGSIRSGVLFFDAMTMTRSEV